MRNHRIGRRKVGIVLCCMVISWVLWYFFGPCKIVPIEGSMTVSYADDSRNSWIVVDQCIVVRPSGNLFKLREAISKYDQNYPIDTKLVEKKIKEMYGKEVGNLSNISIEYLRLFYKNTSDTPLDWNGKRDENKDGMEADHRQDLIGSVRWQQGDAVKKYICTKWLGAYHNQRIFFYKDGSVKFREYSVVEGSKEYDLENWY